MPSGSDTHFSALELSLDLSLSMGSLDGEPFFGRLNSRLATQQNTNAAKASNKHSTILVGLRE